MSARGCFLAIMKGKNMLKKWKTIDFSKLILVYIAVNPIFDMMYTIWSDFSGMEDYGAFAPNQIFRILYIVVLVLNLKKLRDFITIFLIGSYLLFTVVVQSCLGYTLNLVTNINLIGKVIYFAATIIVISRLLELQKLSEEKLIKPLVISTVIISVSILISPFGLGYRGYEHVFSFKGLFGYANFVSGCLLGILPILVYVYKGKKRIFYVLLDYSALLLLGSKASVAGGTAVIVIMLCYLLKYESAVKFHALIRIKKIWILFACVSLCLITVMAVFLWNQIQYFNSSNYSLINFLTSHRNLQTEYASEFIKKLETGKILTILFGLGCSKVSHILNSRIKSFYTIEQDYNGILFYFGVLAFAILCLFTARVMYVIWKLLKKNMQKYFPYALSFMVLLFQSILVGHVIYVPLASIYFAIVIAFLLNDFKNETKGEKSLSEKLCDSDSDV